MLQVSTTPNRGHLSDHDSDTGTDPDMPRLTPESDYDTDSNFGNEFDEDRPDIFHVFAAERKKRANKSCRLPEASTPKAPKPPPSGPAPQVQHKTAPQPDSHKAAPQYQYQCNAEDQKLIDELVTWLWQGDLVHITPAHLYAASPSVRKEISERLRVRHVKVTSYGEPSNHPTLTAKPSSCFGTVLTHLPEPAYSLLLQEIDVTLGNGSAEPGLLDPGSQIVVIRKDLAQELNAHINAGLRIEMEGANSATNWTLGCAENIPMHIGGVSFKLHAHIVECAPFRLLLGCPFQHQVLCSLDPLPDGSLEVFIRDPSDTSRHIPVPSRARTAQVASIWVLSYHMSPTFPSPLNLALAYQQSLISTPISHHHKATLAYKKVANKVRPMPASLPEDFRNVRCFPEDPLLMLPSLPTSPPDFVPGLRLTEERLNALDLNKSEFLWPEELKLLQHVLLLNESGLAWTEDEKGRFRNDYFAPVKIPAIEHVPWIHKNIPIPYGILDDVIQIFKDKLAAGVYEPSDASYCSRFFCVKKKNGSLCLVHNLQPLNAVTIRNSGVPPLTNQIIESMAGRACYAMLDLFVRYDHRTLDIASRDLTTVQSPIGAVQLTCLPQGWTNTVAIFHNDVTFILAAKIPDKVHTFIDDCAIKGPPS